MDRDDIFDKIVEITAEVTKVSAESIKDKNMRSRRIVRARAIILFWCDTAQLDDEDIAECTEYTIHGIKKLRDTLEERWGHDMSFLLMTMEVGKRADLFLQTQGYIVDMQKVFNKWQRISGRDEIKPASWAKYNEV